ncbi:leukotoxin LktA family filamentous adhesin [Fusobacterium necrophorum]|uniref:leukotoxin LktA family filamentous adhesin n=1 Tax=Fusobacterium necrophorum TaxID=859 RepID=UPI00254A7518|nr:leukotoxin LktA family filamentous adhesin [Fusobacterium necrophorum]MDK4475678.1 leukotoxin LktA family filamentous adhesin [Fusobacterium necrophorum]
MSGIKNNVRRTRKRISDSKKVLMILGLLINTMTAVADDSIKETQGFGTKVEKQGNVYDITTNKIKDKNAFNSFDKFHLEQNNIANMHFGSKGGKEAENLFNFVKGKIEVNGVINGIRDNKIGGNLYFLSSEGLLVGKTGVINAGTFRAISPKKEEYEKAFKDAQNSKVFDGIVPQQDGSIKIPLNPNGSITVEGKINAVDEIGLYAADIKLPETGALKTGVTDFHQLVNIKDSNVNAGLSGDLKATKTGTGDIILSAKVEEAGHELESSTIYEQIGRNFKGKIKANIETSGSIEAEGHAKIHAEASNGKLTKKDGEKEVYAPEFSLAEVEASVKVNKGKIKGKKVDISAEAKNYYDTPILTKVGKIAFSVGTGSLSPINMNGALGLLKSKASVFIGKDATVESTEGEANIRSYSGVRASMGASTSPIKLTDLYLKTLEGKLPSVGAAYISTSSESDVTVEGKVSSKEKANITSKSENTIDASVSVGTIRDSNKVGISVLVTEGKNHSSVKIAEGAKVESDGDANVKSEAVNSIRAAVKSGLSDNGAGVVAANISNYNSSSKVVVDGEVHAKKRLNTEAYNITKQNVLQTGTKTGTSKLMNELVFESSHTKALIDALQYRFGGDEKIKSKLTDLFSVGASATVANHNNTSSVSLGQKSKLVSGVEGTNIKALTETQQLRSTTTSGSLATRGEEKKKLVGNAAVFYGNYKNDASVTIADDAQVVSEGKIDTISENKLEYKNPSKMAEEVVEKLEILKRAFEKEKKDETTFDPKDIDSMKKLLTEFSKKLDDKPEILLNGEKITIVLPDGTSKTGTVPELAEYVKEEMKKLEAKLPTGFKAFSEGLSGLLKESLAFTGVGNYANFHTFTSAGTNAKRDTSSVGGAVSWVEMDNHSKVSIGRGSKITAKGDLNVKAINKTETVNLVGKLGLSKSSDSATAVGGGLNVQKSNTSSIVVTKEKAELSGENIHTNAFNNVFHVAASLNAGTGGNGINGMGSYSGGSSKSRVSIDDETHLKAKKKIYLDSENNTSVTNVAGAVAIGSKNAAVGAAVAINDYDISNKVSIEDNDTEDGGKSKYDKNKEEVTVTAEDLHANAKTTGTINAVSVAGGISKVGEAESDGTGIFSKIGNKVDSVKGKITDAIGFVTDQVTNYVYRGSNGTEDGIPNISKESSKLPSFSLGASGSVSVNNIKKETSAVMDGVKISLSGANKEVGVTSSDSTFVGAWSGSAALQWNHIGSGNSNFSASLAGAAAANNIQSKTNAVVKNSSIQNANKFKVNALSGGTQVAAGAGLEAAKESGGQGKSYLLGTSASINLVDNEVSAKSENNIVEGESENKKMNVDVTAYEADTQVTGALDLQAGKSSGTAGAAITVAKLNNKVNASISGGKYTKVNRADAKALLATTQVTAAVATGGTISSGAGLGNYQGVVSVNKIDNDVEAGIDKSSIEGADEVNVIAKDVKGSSNLAKEYQALLNGKDEKYLKDRGIDTTGNGYYTKEQLEEAKKKEGAVIVNAALSVAGTDKSAGGVAIAVNTVKNKFKAELNGKDKEVEEGKIRAKHVNVEAKSSTVVVNAASGLAVSKDAFSGMGSGAWQDLSNETVAKVNKGRISTDSLNVTANNSVLGVNVAGTIAGSLSTAVGAAFANNTLHNKTSALITETKVNSFSGKDTKINAQALNDSHITNVSAGVAASVKQVEIGGMVSVNRGSDETEALVSDSEFDGVNSVDVRAEDKKVLNTIAGNINGGQAAGVGATVAHTNIGKQSVTAAIKNSKITTAKNQDKKNINVTAKDSVVMNTVAAGVGGAKGASVQGSSASTTLNKTVSAHVEKTDIDKENHESKEKADFNVLAENTSQVVTNATVLAGASGQAAVGAGVAGTVSVNKLSGKTEVDIQKSDISTKSADISAKHYGVLSTGNGSVGAAVKGAGVGAAVAVTKDLTNTNVRIKDSKIVTKTKLDVIAQNHTKVNGGMVGIGAAGVGAGLAGTVSVNNITSKVGTEIDHSELLSEEDVNVKALNKVDSSMMAAGGAAGLGAASGVVSVNTVNTSVVTRVHNNSKITSSKGSTNVKAEEEKNIKQVVANAVAGGVSVGANVLVNNFGTAVEDKAAETGKGTEILKTLEEINKDQDQKISEDAAKILKSNGIDTKDYAVKADRGETQAEGIKVFVENSSIKGKNTNIAANQTDNVTSTGGAGSAGVASALGTVGVTNIKRNIGVFINNADVKADEKLSVRSDISGNVSLTSYQGTVGALGLGAAYSQINANGQSNITIKNSRFAAKHIDVIAKDKSQLKAEAKGLTVGAVAAGAIISKANNEMNSEIEIEKSIFNEENRVSSPSKGIGREINVKVEKENRVTAESQGASVGAVAGAGIISDAKDAGNSYLKVSTKSGRSIFHADNVNMEATHKMKVTAGSKAVTGSVLGGVGVTKAEATSAGKVMVEIEEGNLFRTNRLNAISKVEGLDEDKVTAKSFVVSGNGGGIAGAGVNTSTAQSNTESVVRLRKQDYENNDSTKKYISEVNALAVNDTKNEANIESLEVAGVYAQGTNKAFTKSDKLTSTTVNGGKVYQLRAKALAKNENYGNVKGSGGALVGAETAAVENYVKSTTGASVAGEWEIGDKLETIAKDNTIVKVNGDGTKGGLVGKNGISVKNTILGETKSFIDDKAKIAGTGSVNVEALNELDVDLQGKSGGYGGIGVGNVDISNVIKKDTEAKIGQHAVVETTGKQEYQAFTKAKVNILGKGDAAAAAAISNVHVSNEMDIKNLAKQYAYSQLTTKNSKNDITLASSSELDVNVHGVAEAKGVGAKATSSVKNQINRANNVDLAGKIKTEGNINVYAGYDKNYNISKTNSKAIADAKSHAAAASATATIEKNEVKFNNAIREFKNNLAKLEGKVNKEVSTGLNQVDWYTDKYTWHSSEKAYKKLTYQSKKGEKNKK